MNGKKITAQVLGGAVAGIVVWSLNTYAHAAVPAEIAVAFGTVFAWLASKVA